MWVFVVERSALVSVCWWLHESKGCGRYGYFSRGLLVLISLLLSEPGSATRKDNTGRSTHSTSLVQYTYSSFLPLIVISDSCIVPGHSDPANVECNVRSHRRGLPSDLRSSWCVYRCCSIHLYLNISIRLLLLMNSCWKSCSCHRVKLHVSLELW